MFVASEDDFMVDNLQRNTAFYVRILSVCYKEDTSNPRHELVNRANTPVDLTSIGVASGGSNVFLVGFVRLDVGCSFRVESGIITVHPSNDDVYGEVVSCFFVHECVRLLQRLCDQSHISGCL